MLRLAAGETRTIETGDDEVAVLPLSITELAVEVDGERFELAGRADVFARVTDFVYAGRDSTVTLHGEHGRRGRHPDAPGVSAASRRATGRPRTCRSRSAAPASAPAR